MNAAQTYANKLAQDLTKITMKEFFKQIHHRFYNDVDISFMEYFLKLTHQGEQFVVHHSKLREYGVMTSIESSKVKTKLDKLELKENKDYILLAYMCEQDRQNGILHEKEDFLLGHMSEQDRKHGGSNKKEYYITPKSFKKCLMRAKRHGDQPIDPVIYCDYYLLLEDVYKLYTDYEREYADKLLTIKDDKIDELKQMLQNNSDKLDTVNTKLDTTNAQLSIANAELSAANAKLNVLNNIGTKHYHLSRSMIRNLDHQQLTSDKLMNLTSDAVNELNRMNEYVHSIHNRMEAKHASQSKNVKSQGRIWLRKCNDDNSVDLIFRVGKKSYLDKIVSKITSIDAKWEPVFEFKYVESGMNYKMNIKDVITKRFKQIVKTLNEKRAKALETYPKRLEQYEASKTELDHLLLTIEEKQAEVTSMQLKMEFIESESQALFTQHSSWYKSPMKYIKVYNKEEATRYSNAVETLRQEIEDHNTSSSDTRDIDEEISSIPAANVISTKYEWYELKNLTTAPKKVDYRSPIAKELKSKIRATEKSVEGMKQSVIDLRQTIEETENAKVPPSRMQKILNRIYAMNGPHSISEFLVATKLTIDSNSNINLQAVESDSDVSESDSEIRFSGYKLIQKREMNLEEFKNLIDEFEETQDLPEVETDIADVDNIQDRVQYLNEEKSEIEDEAIELVETISQVNQITADTIEL